MIKWLKIKKWIRTQRKAGYMSFKIVTTDKIIVYYVEGTDIELRLNY